MSDWFTRDANSIMSTYSRLPVAIEKGEGSYLIDVNGKKYLDLFTGLAVNLLGHSHPKIVQTLKEQGEQFLHISNVFLNKPAITLAEKLIKQSIEGKVFYTNSGAEATEAALKLIHKHSVAAGENRKGVIVLKKSFHGRTLGAIKLTRQPGVYQDFPTTDTPVYELEPENLEMLKATIEQHKPAALIMEPILGSGGILPLSKGFLEGAEALCRKNGVLFCMDEIQTGIGRTGSFFAYQQTNVEPDLILFAKGVGGGLPLGGIIVAKQYADLFKPGDHGTTFAPSPLSAALGNTVLEVLLEDGQMEKSKETSDKLWTELAQLKETYSDLVLGIRGKGMMVGLVLSAEAPVVKDVQKRLLEKGFMVDVTQQTIIRLLPPLTISTAEIDLLISAIKEEFDRLKEEGLEA
ncbi:acetylornithine aminotransferase [Alkalihalobacillus alcalophilus ATCC 27647 = CGMCC 1.3604]|uniref:Acetylornithine aminotransferase n=1 Tax=Alkalihalobacillus alcalophilus ATCC 27647 = CGMCC 1.3604 TaxID=1218173 RepID=A0A094WPY8_ALKAL|nr:acetylornithine transaminase [Alkalihalobacillus alcalophilus]KGA98886.1 acetylornithine aminotransferase [Alkalihalobacillus alcalophilus ATCC 27647 = CGMCC 1.3604]MED1560524.1 acetylornithine transaminase [Alkalihalobacillus alcalophilus]THG88922.1 acetylornithine aminotransferase [Alkalihalobacillus alcalophilus ATCC 27647 = CGMCC 1.3604]